MIISLYPEGVVARIKRVASRHIGIFARLVLNNETRCRVAHGSFFIGGKFYEYY